MRAVSTEGLGRIRYDSTIRGLLDSDASVRRFFEGETPAVPGFYAERVRRDLGPLWDWLPAGALEHDPNAYLAATLASSPTLPRLAPKPAPHAPLRAAGRVTAAEASVDADPVSVEARA